MICSSASFTHDGCRDVTEDKPALTLGIKWVYIIAGEITLTGSRKKMKYDGAILKLFVMCLLPLPRRSRCHPCLLFRFLKNKIECCVDPDPGFNLGMS